MTSVMESAASETATVPFVQRGAAPPGPREWDSYLSHHGKSFWMAAQLIPQPYRTQLAGVYAYCRYTDDLVDHATCSRGELLRLLERWEGLSRAAYDGGHTGIELLDIVIREMAQRNVPFEYVEGMMRGMRADVSGARFDTLGQLEGYCHDVASVVGLWLTELFGVHDRWTLDRAARLGVALQLTNIARDVGEDWDRGRLYLPQSMLDAHGVTEQMIDALRHGNAPIPGSYAALLEELMTVAEADYAEAETAMGNLPTFFRSSVAVASRVYRGIHDAIRANGYDSIRRRAMTSQGTKLLLAREALSALEPRRVVGG
ncbi:MAG: phytoene/squalene synthase family protein [Gemmatimonadota bacterium]|nr:phytoene/squalene synthase family protein [Gemmatimonadota bacterium]